MVLSTTRTVQARMQSFCSGPHGSLGWLPVLARLLPLHRNVTILDAGANIGTTSLLLAQLIAFRGTIFAVEAQPETAALIARNTAPLQPDRIKVVQRALVPFDVAERTESQPLLGRNNMFASFRVDHEEEYQGTRPRALGSVVGTTHAIGLPMLQVSAVEAFVLLCAHCGQVQRLTGLLMLWVHAAHRCCIAMQA